MVQAPVRHKFSVDSLLLMSQAGVFSDHHRIELLAGEIIDMSSTNAPHATAVRNLLRIFQQQLATQEYIIDVQNPVQLSGDSLPQPDIVIASYKAELLKAGYWKGADVRLIVEVSDSPYCYDRSDKYAAYAQVGVPEYWIVNLKKQQYEVFTQPVGASYANEQVYRTRFNTSLGFVLDVNQFLSFLP